MSWSEYNVQTNLWGLKESKNCEHKLKVRHSPFGLLLRGRTWEWESCGLSRPRSHWLWSPSLPQWCQHCPYTSLPASPRWESAVCSVHTKVHLCTTKKQPTVKLSLTKYKLSKFVLAFAHLDTVQWIHVTPQGAKPFQIFVSLLLQTIYWAIDNNSH